MAEKKEPETEQQRISLIDKELLKLRPSTNPLDKPVWSLSSWLYYWAGFPLAWSLTLLMCILGWFLACYGYIKLIRSTKVSKNLLKNNNIKKRKNKILSSISIIVPCFNEKESIKSFLLFLQKNCINKKNIEIILIDGISKDNWWELIKDIEYLLTIPIKVIRDGKTTGRGNCIRLGYEASSNDILLFLHTDSIVSYGYDNVCRNIVNQPDIVLGSFAFTVDRSIMKFPVIGLGCMELFARIRNDMFWLPYGDQGYFISRDIYDELNGMPIIPLGEDVFFTTNARKFAIATNGRIHIDTMELYCSPKRWEKNGVAFNTFWNQVCVYCLVYRKWTPEDVYELYYGIKLNNQTKQENVNDSKKKK